MTFTINEIVRCNGGGHWNVVVTVNNQSKTFQLEKEGLDLEPDELKDAALHRIRSALIESNALTFQQARNTLINNTFAI